MRLFNSPIQFIECFRVKKLFLIAFAIAVALMIPVGIVAPKGEAPLFALVAVAALTTVVRTGPWREIVHLGWIRFLVSFAVLALLSVFWSFTPWTSFRLAGILGLTLLGFVVLHAAVGQLESDDRVRIAKIVFWAFGFGICILAFDHFSGGIIIGTIRRMRGIEIPANEDMRLHLTSATSIAALALWPWLLAVRERFGWMWAVTGGVFGLVVMIFGNADTTPIAFAIGLFAAGTAWFLPKTAQRLMLASLVVVLLGTPVAVKYLPDPAEDTPATESIPNSLLHRVFIWKTALSLIEQRPFIGYGINTSRSFYDKSSIRQTPLRGGKLMVTSEPIPLHPHNGTLQIWLELGLLGVLSIIGVLAMAIRKAFAQGTDPARRSVLSGLFTTVFVIGQSSFGIWQSWWIGVIILSTAMTFAVLPQSDSVRPHGPA